jgi:cytochrome oxidase assembly protein ShyY1
MTLDLGRTLRSTELSIVEPVRVLCSSSVSTFIDGSKHPLGVSGGTIMYISACSTSREIYIFVFQFHMKDYEFTNLLKIFRSAQQYTFMIGLWEPIREALCHKDNNFWQYLLTWFPLYRVMKSRQHYHWHKELYCMIMSTIWEHPYRTIICPL